MPRSESSTCVQRFCRSNAVVIQTLQNGSCIPWSFLIPTLRCRIVAKCFKEEVVNDRPQVTIFTYILLSSNLVLNDCVLANLSTHKTSCYNRLFIFLEPSIYLSKNFLYFYIKSEFVKYSKDLSIKRIATFMVPLLFLKMLNVHNPVLLN